MWTDYKLLLFIILFTASAKSSVVISPDSNEYQVLPMAALKETQNGCTAPTGIKPIDSSKKWLGMVRKGGCPILTKYNVLKDLGASGMLILDGDGVEYTATDHFHVVSIEMAMYDSLMKMYEETNKYPSVKIVHSYRTSMPIVQILYIIFLVLMIFVFPSLFERLEEPQIKLVKPKELSTVSIKTYSEVQGADRKYEECPICFEKFDQTDFIRTLQCKHYYHGNCIDPWLLSRSCRCPVCNHELSFA
ncbi:hypothetical protein NEMIN01_0750 [Nematocida minor]|uniref:uncharacterized protein n=1 Tax=Nematocida minor TaxID=1912983 RepID=UPI00221FB7C0|nr:uncharacterized protein NEMIN01_0750 [Nematocida minor]KAI5189887.1 hypothetical protein NEMIN01_0750 [Nematocida minor]